MSYGWTSIGEVVGRVIRRTGLKDTSLIPDMNEWIAEAMQLIQLTLTLEHTFDTTKSSFHKAKKPCGMAELYAIEYCGCRLPLNNTIRDPRAPWTPLSSFPSVLDAVFVSTVTRENTPSGNFLFTSEFQKLQDMSWHATSWYKEDGNYILTSFDSGEMKVFYGRVPVDRDGILMIPDEGNYKEALTWFLKARLAGRGVTNDSEDKCDQKFELWAGRSREQITLSSVEKMEATTNQLVRLLPDENYYESMFTGTAGRYTL